MGPAEVGEQMLVSQPPMEMGFAAGEQRCSCKKCGLAAPWSEHSYHRVFPNLENPHVGKMRVSPQQVPGLWQSTL